MQGNLAEQVSMRNIPWKYNHVMPGMHQDHCTCIRTTAHDQSITGMSMQQQSMHSVWPDLQAVSQLRLPGFKLLQVVDVAWQLQRQAPATGPGWVIYKEPS
jgi:hypothetical protein